LEKVAFDITGEKLPHLLPAMPLVVSGKCGSVVDNGK